MTDATLGLADHEYWDYPEDKIEQLDERLHVGEDFRGICLGGPSEVSLEARSTVPVLVYQNDSNRNRWRYRFEERGVIVAVDHRANVTYARQAIERDAEVMPTRSPEPPDEPGMTASSAHEIELRNRLHLPWVRAGYWVNAIVRDQVSNRVHIQVGLGSGRYHDEEVERYIEELRGKAATREVRPPVGELPIPHYGLTDSSPDLPREPGIAFTLPRVLLLRSSGPRTPWLLEGSFRLPALPRDLVGPGGGALARYPERATAVVDITVGSVAADEPGPWVIPLGVPSFDPIDPSQRPPIVTGHFLVDLLELPECPSLAQTYFAFAFSCDAMTGPVPAALVDEPMLPPDVLGVR